jgi:ABC-type glycerol-3-phosphate transport system permease component
MRKSNSNILKYIVLMVFVFYALIPIFIMWLSALKTNAEISASPFGLPEVIQWRNIIDAWSTGHFGRYVGNTFIITLPTVFLVVYISSMAGYAIGKLKFAGSKLLFYIFLIGLMIPFQAIMIPLYYLVRDMKLLGTYWAMILPASGLGMPFGIFLMQAFFRGLPSEVMDAARIDGCNEFNVFFRVMLPLASPAVSTLLVFQFMWTWNSFIMPLLLLNEDKLRPISLGLLFFKGQYTVEYNLIAAGVTIVSLPVIIVFIIFQRQFIQGITAGATKG